MSITNVGSPVLRKALAASCLAGILTVAGCSNRPKYLDSQNDVRTALNDNNLGNVQVSQNRDRGIITLTGAVSSQQQRTQARQITRTAAPTYTIDNQITVTPPPPPGPSPEEIARAKADHAIESEFKAQMEKHRYFRRDDIAIESKDGSVTLSGTAHSTYDKRQAEKLAKSIPNVRQVVNQIEVKQH